MNASSREEHPETDGPAKPFGSSAGLSCEILESMLIVCGCELDFDETSILIERLEEDPTVVSDEAAAAIRYAAGSGSPAGPLDRDVREAISHVLHEPLPPRLAALRDAVASGCC